MKIYILFCLFAAVISFSCERTQTFDSPDDEEAIHDQDEEAVIDEDEIQTDDIDFPDETMDEPEPVPVFSLVEIKGEYGDIEISFSLNWRDLETGNVKVEYFGACNDEDFEELLYSGNLKDLSSGLHSFTWHSWDQQAGCSGEVSLRFISEEETELFESIFELKNIGVNSGFVTFPQIEQGILPHEMSKYEEAKTLLLDNPATAFVATRMGDVYEVAGPDGWIRFVRNQTNKGYVYEIIESEGTNPIENQNPIDFPTYEEELARGGNPLGTTMTHIGYSAGDPRLSYIEPEDDSYPFGYHRLTAFFDNPNAPDLYVNPKGYTHATASYAATHGSLNMVQSRSPLLIWGKGVKKMTLEEPVRVVDIAPTVGALMGFPKIKGIDHRGIKSSFNYLQWQDGKPIKEVLNGELADHVIIIVSDGLNKTQLDHLMDKYPSKMTAFHKMKNEGVYARYGSITNFPSNTYPSHNVLGSGIYSGHTGVLDNSYFIRDKNRVVRPIVETVGTSQYFDPVLPEGETLHEAVKRVFGTWEMGMEEGGYTMSIFCPSVKGADTSDIELVDRSGKIMNFSTLMPAKGTSLPTMPVSEYKHLAVQATEAVLLSQLEILFGSGPNPRPGYAIINFMTSDAVGHDKGPHGDLLYDVMRHINHNLELIFEWLWRWGILDSTAIIFTSDHGMQLGDPQRYSSTLKPLEKASFSIHEDTNYGIYFK